MNDLMKASVHNLLSYFKNLGIHLELADDNIRIGLLSQHAGFTNEMREVIKQRKREIVCHLKEVSNSEQTKKYIEKADRSTQNCHPLSFAQKRIWFLEEYESGEKTAYNVPLAIKLSGDLDIGALERAINYIIERHESLRTFFGDERGIPFQQVIQQLYVELRVEERTLEDIESILEADAEKKFNLGEAPLFRLRLFKLFNTANEFIFYLNQSHLITDGWSVDLLLKELEQLYTMIIAEEEISLPELDIQYIDYSYWQNDLFTEEAVKTKSEFWLNYLQGYKSIEMPTDYPRLPVFTFDGMQFKFIIQKECKQKLSETAFALGGTLFSILLTAYKLFLQKYSNQSDIVVGVPVANRQHPSLEGILGFFVNSIPVRTDLSESQTFSELHENIKNNLFDVYAHQDVPFEKIIEALHVERDISSTPIFQTMMVLQNANDGISLSLPDVAYEEFEISYKVSKFDLTLFVMEKDEYLECIFEFNTNIFKKETVREFAKRFELILSQVSKVPNRSLTEISLLQTHEKEKILFQWNSATTNYNTDLYVNEMFEAQVKETPDAEAVVFGNEALSYLELDEQANQLAHYLVSKGVGPEKCVGIFVKRSLEAMISFLAVMKANGAFVPLDPDYPAQRLGFILEDCKAEIVLTQRGLEEKLPDSVEPFFLNDDLSSSTLFPKTRPEGKIRSENLAYVIYTSGSTGKPKGVMIEHRGFSHYIQWASDYYGCSNGCGSPVYSSLAFDLTMTALFTPLVNGKTVFMINDELGIGGLLEALNLRQDYGLIKITPAHLRLLQNELDIEKLKNLQSTVIIGGEALFKDDLLFWYKHSPKLRFVNEYGATETSVACTIYEIGENLPNTPIIPVGKAIPMSQMYVLGKHSEPLPIGVIGEIHLSGNQLARGYLNREKTTKEKFLPHPYLKGEVIYKTGDLGRLLADGNVEFLGRTDDQIKIKGYRVELGEIESTLMQHEDVSKCVIVAKGEKEQKRLLAYCVPEGQSFNKEDLDEHLRLVMPDYMIPSAFIKLETLPLTINGKVDKSKLPDPKPEHLHAEYWEPGTEEEYLLAHIWKQLLRMDRIGIHDNFFSLGGDSILSIQVVSHVREKGFHITPKNVFEYPRIADLAILLKPSASLVIEQGDVRGRCLLTPIQKWFFACGLEHFHHFNQAFVLKPKQAVDVPAFEKAINRLVRHHDAFRLRYKKINGEWVQSFSRNTQAVKLQEITDPNQLQENLNITTGPIVRAGLMGELGGQLILLVIHHLVIDGVSWRIFLEDLEGLYRKETLNAEYKLFRKTSSFKDWGLALSQYAKSTSLKEQAGYWRRVGIGISDIWDIPECSANDGSSIYTIELTEADSKSLLHDINHAYQTKINDILLSALLIAVNEWKGLSDVLINLEGHGREEFIPNVDSSRTIGWFTCQYPVHLSMPQKRDIGEIIKSVKEHIRKIPDHGVGYGVLRYLSEVNIPAVLPQISFNYLGQFNASNTESSMWDYGNSATGNSISSGNKKLTLLEINGLLTSDIFTFNFISDAAIPESDVSQLAERYKDTIAKIIAHCKTTNRIFFTPSDFPLARLNQQQLETLTCTESTNIQTIYGLSPLQTGLLFHSIYTDDSRSYLVQSRWSFHGGLKPEILKSAWKILIDRHEIFRAKFSWENAPEPVQVIYKEVSLLWKEIDLSNWDQKAQKEELDKLVKTDQDTPFDFDKPSLTRLSLIKLAEEEYYIIWSIHHLIVDGWCMQLLFAEIATIYGGLMNHGSLPSSPSYRYENYINWIQSQNQSFAEVYWKSHLKDLDFTTPLPFSKPGKNLDPNKVILKHDYCDKTVDSSLMGKLDKLVKKYGVTQNSIIQFAWAYLLSMYNCSQDIVFGTVFSGRSINLPHVEKIVGLFINTLPIRVKIDQSNSILNHIKELQDQIQNHSQFTFSSLSDIKKYSEITTGKQLFNNIVVYENYPIEKDEISFDKDVHVSGFENFEKDNFPLTLFVLPFDSLTLRFAFDIECFEKDRIVKALEHLVTILEKIAEHVDSSVSDISLTNESEKSVILDDWNQTKQDYPSDKTLIDLFEQAVIQAPTAVALVYGARQLTYQELDKRANQLAHLIKKETGLTNLSNEVIGLRMERCLEMVVGIYGILKAGAAYLPLEPSYPEDRQAFMIQESGARLVVDMQSFVDLDYYPTANPGRTTEPDDLAYVIYTSGSTGKPKGVMLSHRGAVNRIDWMQKQYRLTTQDTVLQKTPFSFDVSVWEFVWPLVTGSRLVVAEPEGHKDPIYLANLIKARQITTLHFVPSMLRAFLEASPVEELLSIRQVFCSGEGLPTELSHALLERLPDCRVHNLYGPTEASIDVSYWECQPSDRNDYLTTPIGKPIQNMRLYVLDEQLRPVPSHIPGELYISGVGLARGYINRNELTKKRFIASPFVVGERLYKTGDLAKWLPNGALEYLGRLDDQVKLRGFRIELGEIEAVISDHEGVRQGVVMVDRSGVHPRLVGYYVPSGPVDKEALHRHISERLPEYMVPCHLQSIDSVPLSSNGKLDRKSLPKVTISPEGSVYVSPETEEEKWLAEIWQDLLQIAKVGRHDNFFRLGGDSILCIQLVSRIRQQGLYIQVQDIFTNPTVAKLSTAVNSPRNHKPLVEEVVSGSFELLPAQQWFFREEFKKPHHWNQARLLRVKSINESRLVHALKELVKHHDTFRLRIHRDKDLIKQTYSNDIERSFNLQTVDCKHLHGSDETHFISQRCAEWHSLIDFSQGPVLVAGILAGCDDGYDRLLLTVHHLFVDEVSWRVLIPDLMNLYHSINLQDKTNSSKKWLKALKRYSTNEQVEKSHLLYWEKIESALIKSSRAFKLQQTRTKIADSEMLSRSFHLSASETKRLLAETSQAYHTQINDLLLAAFSLALKGVLNSNCVAFKLEGHGREFIDEETDVSRTLGWFTSFFPVIFDLPNTRDLSKIIIYVKESLRKIPDRGLSYGALAYSHPNLLIREKLNPDLLPAISFNYLGQIDSENNGEVQWAFASESVGDTISKQNHSSNILDVNGWVMNGKLVFTIGYASTIFCNWKIEAFADEFSNALLSIADHCTSRVDTCLTPSDFESVQNEFSLGNLQIVHDAEHMYDPFPMTDIQVAYLLGRHSEYEIGNTSNHLYSEQVYGQLDLKKLELAINRLIMCVNELRLVFDENTLTQKYLKTVPNYNLLIRDFSNRSFDSNSPTLLEIRKALSHRVYDASLYPLFDFSITRFKDAYVFHVSIDLILVDADSRKKMFMLLHAIYQNPKLELPGQIIVFRDYMMNYKRLQQSSWYNRDRNYWLSKLPKLPSRPELPLKMDPMLVDKPVFAKHTIKIEKKIWDAFKQKCLDHKLSPSSALLLVFGTVISRWSQTDNFLITLTIFNRLNLHPSVFEIFGDFTSTSIFGFDTIQKDFLELVQMTHQNLWDDLEHKFFSGIELQREIVNQFNLNPQQAVSPIVFTGYTDIVRENGDNIESFIDQSELKTERYFQAQTSQAWIDLQAIDHGDYLESIWYFVTQLFDEKTIDAMNKAFCHIVTFFSKSKWDLPVPEIIPQEDMALIQAANSTFRQEIIPTQSIPQRFVETASLIHDQIAIVSGTGSKTYFELLAYASQIANCLLEFKLENEQLIAVFAEKGWQQVASCLGIMMAGFAYLPLNIEWPVERVSKILETGGCNKILTTNELFFQNSSRDFQKYHIISLQSDHLDLFSNRPPNLDIDPDSIAYVIFTSGSTGQPKGVAISHQGIMNTLNDINHRFKVDENDRVFALSNLSFDLSVYDIFGTLIVGGTIVMPSETDYKNPKAWVHCIIMHHVTVWNSVPMLMQMMVEYLQGQLIDSLDQLRNTLRIVLLSGDWIPLDLAERIKEIFYDVSIFSLGGATEASIWSNLYPIKEVKPHWKSIPYGKAMYNQKMYILNNQLEYCPINVIGEICIGGMGLAACYWNDQEKTDLHFVIHPRTGERIYKTGDLGRLQDNGNIEFIGRKDSQVKIGGYRVELGEIEMLLNQHPKIKEAVVDTIGEKENKQLISYIVPESDDYEKLHFKLKRLGIHLTDISRQLIELEGHDNLSTDLFFSRKSYRSLIPRSLELNELTSVLKSVLNKDFFQLHQPHNWDNDFGNILAPLSSYRNDTILFPKFCYPSAGGLYPVRLYLSTSKLENPTNNGVYYYHPDKHALIGVEPDCVAVREIPDDPTISLYGYLPAIEPQYGEASKAFCLLEAGYMLHLIEDKLNNFGLCLHRSMKSLHLFDHQVHFHLGDFCFKRKASRDKPLDFKLYIVDKREQEWALYQWLEDKLVVEQTWTPESTCLYQEGRNISIVEDADFLLLFGEDESQDSLLSIGKFTQEFMNRASEKTIGTCAIGHVELDDVLKHQLGLSLLRSTVAVGKITEEDVISRMASQSRSEQQWNQKQLFQLLKKDLSTKLPSYMIPEQYMTLEKIPLNANGKIDRKSLSTLTFSQFDTTDVKPQTSLEKSLCAIWEEILCIPHVGVTDDFFILGGNSITAIRLINRIQNQIGAKIEIRKLFEYRTIHTLIENIDFESSKLDSKPLVQEEVQWI